MRFKLKESERTVETGRSFGPYPYPSPLQTGQVIKPHGRDALPISRGREKTSLLPKKRQHCKESKPTGLDTFFILFHLSYFYPAVHSSLT